MVLSIKYSRPNDNLQMIVTTLFDDFSHIKHMLNKHIINRAYVLTVEPYLRKAINSTKEKLEFLSFCERRGCKMPVIAPLITFPLAEIMNMTSNTRVCGKTGTLQIYLNITRNNSRNALGIQQRNAIRSCNRIFRLLPIIKLPLSI